MKVVCKRPPPPRPPPQGCLGHLIHPAQRLRESAGAVTPTRVPDTEAGVVEKLL